MRIDSRYFRPAEVDFLQADTTKARQVLGWEPKVGFQDLVKMMVDADTADLKRKLKGGADALRNPAGVNA